MPILHRMLCDRRKIRGGRPREYFAWLNPVETVDERRMRDVRHVAAPPCEARLPPRDLHAWRHRMIVREHASKPARADQRAAGSRFDNPRAEAVRIEVRIEAMYVVARLGRRHGTAPPEPRDDFGIRIQRRPRFGIVVPPTPQDQTLAPSRYPPVDSSFVPKFAAGRVIGGDTVAIDKRCDPAPHPRPSGPEPITLQLICVRR